MMTVIESRKECGYRQRKKDETLHTAITIQACQIAIKQASRYLGS